MTPIRDGEDVPESEVMNVHKADGTKERYRRRRMGAWHYKNGKLSNDFLEIVMRYATAIKVGFGAITAIVLAFWGINETVILPQQERMIERVVREVAAPMAAKQHELENALAAHILAVAEQKVLYPTKIELKDDLDEIKATLEVIRSRQ